jgi:hypothetical protein
VNQDNYAAAEFFKASVFVIGLRVGFFERYRTLQGIVLTNAWLTMININRFKRSACSSWEFSS